MVGGAWASSQWGRALLGRPIGKRGALLSGDSQIVFGGQIVTTGTVARRQAVGAVERRRPEHLVARWTAAAKVKHRPLVDGLNLPARWLYNGGVTSGLIH